MSRRPYAIVCAPHSPVGCGAEPQLGAANKIEGVLRAAAAAGFCPILLNSAHNRRGAWAGPRVRRVRAGTLSVLEITPLVAPQKKLGKLLGVVFAPAILARVTRRRQVWLWCYNFYFFEVVCAFVSRVLPVAGRVIEYEDAPWTRWGRGWLKSSLDTVAFALSFGLFECGFAVNGRLARSLRSMGTPAGLLPGLLSCDEPLLAEASVLGPGKIRLAYSGGFFADKGFDRLLELAGEEGFGQQFTLCVLGAGPLRDRAMELASRNPSFHVLGPFEDRAEVLKVLAGVDVCLNPHQDLQGEYSGVFPFKLLEYLALGKRVLSTPLPSDVLPPSALVKEGVVGLAGLQASIADWRQWPIQQEDAARVGAYLKRFTESALAATLRQLRERTLVSSGSMPL